MKADRVGRTVEIFQALRHGPDSERRAAVAALDEGGADIDRVQLCRWILELLEGELAVAAVSTGRDRRKTWARTWLLSTLGKIADADPAALQYVTAHTRIGREPNFWARYWALAGLVAGRCAGITTLARAILADPEEDEPLVQVLAKAIVAAAGDASLEKDLLEGVQQGGDWATLRALRIVPVRSAVADLCRIVSAPKLSDTTFDAIVALGALPPDWEDERRDAIRALVACVERTRANVWMDSLRSQALSTLGVLRAASAVPTLLEDLDDSNPSIVYEAARALERILGSGPATGRIVEMAAQSEDTRRQRYANALRWMNRDIVAEALGAIMLSGPALQQEAARVLLSEVGGWAAFQKLRARTEAMRQHIELLKAHEEEIQRLFESSLTEARAGYRLATGMEMAVFALGVGLVILGAGLVVAGRETLAALTAGGGAVAVLYNLFIARPRQRVADAVEHLMRLKVVFLGYLRQLHQGDQAYIRRLLDDAPLEPDEVARYSDLVGRTMTTAAGQLGWRVAGTDREPAADTPPGGVRRGRQER